MINFDEQAQKLTTLFDDSWRRLQNVRKHLIEVIQRFGNTFPEITTRVVLNGFFASVPGDLPLTIPPHNTFFWNMLYQLNRMPTMAEVFRGAAGTPNTPRVQFNILNSRELHRIRILFTQQPAMIDFADFPHDDLVRAFCLSGTFARRQGPNNYSPVFSGMLISRQRYNRQRFMVHTCAHGFGTTITDAFPLNTYYFIPYGLLLNDANAFAVQSVHHTVGGADHNYDELTLAQRQQEPAYGYRHSDYACALINRMTENNDRDLQTVLQDRQTANILNSNPLFNGFNPANEERLPTFLGNHFDNDVRFNNFHERLGNHNNVLRYYACIGRPGDQRLALDTSGFAISVNLDTTYSADPRQSMNEDFDVVIPPEIAVGPGRTAQSYPSYPGMSGGIILQTFYEREHLYRLCRPFGTQWGSERVFSTNPTVINDLVAFTSGIA